MIILILFAALYLVAGINLALSVPHARLQQEVRALLDADEMERSTAYLAAKVFHVLLVVIWPLKIKFLRRHIEAVRAEKNA